MAFHNLLIPLLVGFLLSQTKGIDLAETEQLALESSGELLPSANLAHRISEDLEAIKIEFPELQSLRHIPKWVPGELILFNEKPDNDIVIAKINVTSYGPVEVSEMSPNRTSIMFRKPYNPVKLMQLLKAELGGITDNLGPNEIWNIKSSINITLSKGLNGRNSYLFLRGRGNCSEMCSEMRHWTASVSPPVIPTFSLWGDYLLSEEEQIAFESTQSLVPPVDLAPRIQKDLAAIRSKFKQVDFPHTLQWNPQDAFLLDRNREQLGKLNASRYGPVGTSTLHVTKDGLKLLVVSFEKPYNIVALKSLAKKELGLQLEPNRRNLGIGLGQRDTQISLLAESTSGKNTYEFRKGDSDCSSGCTYWKFAASADGKVDKLGERKERTDVE